MKQTPDYDADDLAAIAHERAERRYLCDPLRLQHDLYALARITADMEALRVRREMARRAIRKAIRPLVIEVTPDMISTSPSQPGIDIKHSSGVDIRVKGVAAQMALPLEAA